MSVIGTIHERVDESPFKNWQAYFLMFSIVSSLAIHFQIELITYWFGILDRLHIAGGITLRQLLIGVFQGIVIGLFSKKLYDSGDRYAKVITNEFDTKEKVFAVRVLLMGGVGVVVGVVLPNLISQYLEYETIQLIGAIVCFGYLLLHLEVTEWDPTNELVVFVSGFWLAFGPLILQG